MKKQKQLYNNCEDILKRYVKTITTNNGGGNTNHQQIKEALGTAVYFFHPYHSWEKGAVESTNGRIR